jgi:tetratricopeptide (TPR) repeat protein
MALGMAVIACSAGAGPTLDDPAHIAPTSTAVASMSSTLAATTATVTCDAEIDTPDAVSQTEALVARYASAVQADPADHDSLLYLGLAYYQLARETADPADYGRADEAFARLLAENPDDVEALIGRATVALARHQFADALATGQKALALSPRTARIHGVIGDALNELGRYDEAAASVDAMARLRPDLSSYSRVSYVRELRGDVPGAITAMEAAIEAGGPAVENTAYLRVILGNLQFAAGDLRKAEGAYRTTLQRMPGYVFALAGVARVHAARGDLNQAIACDRAAADRVPFPEFLIAQGEAQEAAGRHGDAQKTYAFVRQIEALFAANGVNTDLDLALFEADHGDPDTALTLAQAAYAATPNIKAADALGWALYQNGSLDRARHYADESLRLGTLDPSYAYHAGMIAKAQGDTSQARTWLAQSLASKIHWSPLHAPRAAAALAELGGPVAAR